MPHIRQLTRDEGCEVLARNHVGRVAYSLHDRVDIEPVHYVFRGGSLYIRTSLGSKLSELHHHPYVAFEVDESTSLFEWRSAVVHGPVEFLDALVDAKRYAEAVAHVRELIPQALSGNDPVRFRNVLLRVHANEIDARESTVTSR
jgi:nitroimidazol reductase NimA-like FMN-containing flavoprotein (pyridoxamine 5'-phosphate oxidase superfamily)